MQSESLGEGERKNLAPKSRTSTEKWITNVNIKKCSSWSWDFDLI